MYLEEKKLVSQRAGVAQRLDNPAESPLGDTPPRHVP